MKSNSWKKRDGIVYSTNPDYSFPEPEEEVATLANERQPLRINIEKNGRGGKTVTLVKGFIGSDEALEQLCKKLKTRCGVGGACKDGVILIQGEKKEQVLALLHESGFRNAR